MAEKKKPAALEIRFDCHGILSIPGDRLPPGWPYFKAEYKWTWLLRWWKANVTEDMLKTAMVMEVPNEPGPGLLEEFDGKKRHPVYLFETGF